MYLGFATCLAGHHVAVSAQVRPGERQHHPATTTPPLVVAPRRYGRLVGAFLAGVGTAAVARLVRKRRRTSRIPQRADAGFAGAAAQRITTDPTEAQEVSLDLNTGRPDPDDPRKPDSPTDLTGRSLRYVLRQTVREFSDDQCTHLAAALTYYAVLSIFPALVVVVSLLGVFGQGQRTSDTILQLVEDVVPGSAAETLRQPIEQLVGTPSAGFALVVGILGALWSASGYVGAFGRAMNRIYEVDEGRPFWKLRPQQLLLTATSLVVVAAVAFMLAITGPVAETLGGYLGMGETTLTVWNVG